MTEALQNEMETELASSEESVAPEEEQVAIAEAAAEPEAAREEADAEAEPDYATLAEADMAKIRAMRPEYAACLHLWELPFAKRFAELRDLGLSPEEALAAADRTPRGSRGKEHLRSVHPRSAAERMPGMTAGEMRAAKELFGDKLGEREITELYRRATR